MKTEPRSGPRKNTSNVTGGEAKTGSAGTKTGSAEGKARGAGNRTGSAEGKAWGAGNRTGGAGEKGESETDLERDR